MAKPYDFGRVELDIEPGKQETYTPEPETPFRILSSGQFQRRDREIREPEACAD